MGRLGELPVKVFRHLVVLVSVFHVGGACIASHAGDTGDDGPNENTPEMAAAVNQAIQMLMASHDIPGASVAVARDGRIILERGYGWADSASVVLSVRVIGSGSQVCPSPLRRLRS